MIQSKYKLDIDSDSEGHRDLFDKILLYCYADILEQHSSVDDFLSPSLGNILEPSLLKDIDKAVELIFSHIKKDNRILIFGDYDVDGITSTGLMVRFFRSMKFENYDIVIPSRFKHGYGLSENAITEILDRNADLVITVDNGTSCVSEVEILQSKNIDVVVTDHHEPSEGELPDCPIVNPKQKDCKFPDKEITGVGVVFMLLIFFRRYLRDIGFWNDDRREPNISKFMDLVAIGTIADQAPLLNQNRIFVHHGLSIISNVFNTKKGSQYGYLEAIIRTFPNLKSYNVDSELVSYKIAPLLNSAGRMDDGTTGYEFIIGSSPAAAGDKLAELIELNKDRLEVQYDMLLKAGEMANEQEDLPGIVIFNPDFHEGITGIIAGKLSTEHSKPCIVFAQMGDSNLLKGSSRVPNGGSMLEILKGCEEVAVNYGGHNQAAGCTIEKENINQFTSLFQKMALAQSHKIQGDTNCLADFEIDQKLLKPELFSNFLKFLEPHGRGNPRPIFLIRKLGLGSPKVFVNSHFRWQINNRISAIYWNADKSVVTKDRSYYDVAFEIKNDSFYNNGSIQLVIKNMERTMI